MKSQLIQVIIGGFGGDKYQDDGGEVEKRKVKKGYEEDEELIMKKD